MSGTDYKSLRTQVIEHKKILYYRRRGGLKTAAISSPTYFIEVVVSIANFSMKIHDTYISRYKELEQTLNIPVREYEETLPESDKQKMYICRVVRNYIQHNDEYSSFIAISDGMIQFLDDIIYRLKSKHGILKDNMVSLKKYGCIHLSDTVFEAAGIMRDKKIQEMPVIDEKNMYVGFITKDMISDSLGDGITKTTPVKRIKEKLFENKALLLPKDTTMDDVIKNTNDTHVRYVMALNANGTVAGILCIGNF